MGRLLAEEGDGLGGAHRDAHDGSGRSVDAARKIDRQHRRAIGVDRLDHRTRVSLDWSAQPRAEQRVDDERGPADRLRIERQHRIFPAARGGGRVALQRVALAHQDDRHLAALCREFGGRHKTVAAIIPRSGDHHDRPLVDQFARSLSDRLTGTQHQREARRACGDRQPVGALHLSGSENFHPTSPIKRLIQRHFRCGPPPRLPKVARRLICLPISQASVF